MEWTRRSSTTLAENTRPKPRPGSHSAAREQAILAATAELVVGVGYERVTVDAIATRARASKATIYRKWPSKAELVADALRQHAEGRAVELADTGSVRGDLLLTVRNIARTFTGGDAGPSLLGLLEAIRADPVLRDVVRAQIDERSDHDGALICARAVSRGEHVDPERGPAVIGLALAHLFLRTLLGGEPPSENEQRILVDQTLLPLLNAEVQSDGASSASGPHAHH
ncbi:TetR/AcrR family transcriptional regulator [Streptomyces sp. NPDC059092]|uniref:TetR/AcrR family transcriptional regulator n=1 Tax=Streptomyces sp. NPDC059092 TaxID=3346725 RepID=UPI003682B5F7